MGFFDQFFGAGFVPHGASYGWNRALLWLNSVSDFLIVAAFFFIPAMMLYLFRRRPDPRFRVLAWLFAAFIFSCGVARGIAAWNVWHTAYWLEAGLKAVTAGISVAAAALMIKMFPSILRMALPQELERANTTLQEQITQAESQFRQVESERSAGEATLRSYFEAASQGILAVSRQGRITLVNRRTEEMFGYRREELLGQELEMLVPPRYRRTHAGHRHDFFLHPSVRAMGAGQELAGLRQDGSEFPVEIGLSFIETETGTTALGLVSDITDRKQAADELAKSHAEVRAQEAQLRSFLEAASQAIVAVSKDGQIVLVNRRTEEVFGYRREELLGQPLEVLLPERFRAGHVVQRAGFFAAPRLRPVESGLELAGRRKDGTEFPAEIGLSFVSTDEGGLSLSLITDITERKRMAGELVRVNEELRRSNSELEQFAYIASHDLQEPLRMVTSYLNLLELRYREKLDGDAREFIRYAIDGAERMKGLIRDVLRFSRAGTRAIELQEVGVEQVVRRALENLQASIDERNAQIRIAPLPRVFADANMLTHVFQNLIGNAIKFTREGQPQIEIEAEKRDREWIFSIRDHGIGIDPRHSGRLFTIFERLNPSEEYTGTGVGLAICKKIIERHSGRMWVESRLGEGAIFYFSLPGEALAKRPEKSAARV